ncbi:hypothetical protein ACEPPN_011799 [Leptodophora sp. 'Broadleaf-Isolate-01']
MASKPATHPGILNRIPGIQSTYIYNEPDMASYLPYSPPKSPKGKGSAQRPSSPSPCSPQSHSQQVEVLQEMVNKLQLVDASRTEAIIEQKIKIAILKNDLEHARTDKEAIVNSFGIIIESITRGSCVTPSPQVLASSPTSQVSSEEKKIKALEKEIERYRKSDRVLRARIQDLERGDEIRGRARERENGAGSIEREYDVVLRDVGWVGVPVGRGRASEKGTGKMVEREVGSRTSSANSAERQQDTIGPGPIASALFGSWGEGISAELPTIPNSPVAGPALNPANGDIGLCSLEDFLDNDGFPLPIPTNPSSLPSTVVNEFPATITTQLSSLSSTAQAPKLVEDERTIDEQIEENKTAMAKFVNMPTPGVIKTGFALEGSFRGADYDKMKYPHPTRDFDRFAPNTLRSNGYYSRLARHEPPTGPRVSFEAPNMQDRSFDQGLWNDPQDRNGAVEAHMRAANGRNDIRFPDFFRYGIQYIPAETDSNYLRTVIISNLPLGTEARDVLARVRGGDVICATIVKMGRIAPNTVQARVVFKHEAAAEEYVLYAADHPISFSENHLAEVTLVSTPTYPLPAKQVARLREQTRCIAIPNIPSRFSLSHLEHDLACGNSHRAESLIEIYIDETFTLHLQFSSIDMAGSAWAILNNWNAYHGLKCKWEADPCAGDIEELASEVMPRPKVFPDNWANRGAESGDESGSGLRREGLDRKPLAALENQKVSIPDFSATKLRAASWADEVNDDLEEDDYAKVVILDELTVGGCGDDSESESSGSGSASLVPKSKSASVSCVATDGSTSSTSTPAVESLTASEGTQALEIGHASSSATVQVDSIITVLTVDQELQAALRVSNTNQGLATSASASTIASTTLVLPTQKSIIGLAGSKYASVIPAFVDTGRRPRSIHINTSSSSLSVPKTSPKNKTSFASEVDDTLSPQSRIAATGTKHRFSASPPRVDLDGLIKSGRSSFASASESVQSEAEVETQNEEIISEKVDDCSPTQATFMKPKPAAQLFKWFQPPSLGGKKRSYGSQEQEIDEVNLRIPIEELRGGSSPSARAVETEVKVINPDEISLDDEDGDEEISFRGPSPETSSLSSSVELGEREGDGGEVNVQVKV